MEIVKHSIILELPQTLETGTALKFCEKPYRIERIEQDNTIVWYGYNTNWKYENDKWFKLNGFGFIECEEPEYEKIYKQLTQ